MNAEISHYIVTEGEYSDYHIKYVSLDKQSAENYAKIFGGEVEVWPDRQDVPQPYFWQTTIYTDGVIETTKLLDPCESQSEYIKLCKWEYKGSPRADFWSMFRGWEFVKGLSAYGYTADHSKKLAIDAMAKASAELAGI